MKVLYGGEPANVALLKLLRILTGMSWYRFFCCPLDQKAEFLHLSEFLLAGNTLTKNLLPEFDNFFGPADDFNNITGEEFVFSEHHYFKAFSFPEDGPRLIHEEGLNQLVAVLYRPKKQKYDIYRNPDGDPRQPFNQHLCAYNTRHIISRWPAEVKMAVFQWYECCRQQMIEENPDIFSGGSGEEARYGLISVMRVIAEGGIHGTFDQVQKMFVKMWMVELNEKYLEAKRAMK